ncbi:hypothetical protein [Streptomyces sp. NPDC054784]
MGLMDRAFGTPEARRELREARAELDRIGWRDREESDEWIAANDRVVEAEKHARLPR